MSPSLSARELGWLWLVKNNRDRSCNGILLKKQIGGNRDGRNHSTKIRFDSPVNFFERKRKLLRFRNINFGGAELKVGTNPFFEKRPVKSPI